MALASAESVLLQQATLVLSVACWGALSALGRINPRASGPAWWSAALGLTALSILLLPAEPARATWVVLALLEVLGLAAVLAALEGTLRFRGWSSDGSRWKAGLLAVLVAGLVAAPWTGLESLRKGLLDASRVILLVGLAWVAVRGASAADRLGLRLLGAVALLWAGVQAARAGLGGPQPAPAWWWLGHMVFVVGWTTALLLACYGRAHARVQALATQDLLTSLPNGRQFENRLAGFVDQVGRGGAAFSLLMLEVQGVKEVNAMLGRDAGDALLVEFARRLRRALRHADAAARTGGYEFGVLLHDLADPTALKAVSLRLLQSLQGPLKWQGHTIELRCSAGAAAWSEALGRLEELRALADRRLRATTASQAVGETGPIAWLSPSTPQQRPPGTRSRASDRGSG